MWFNLLARGVSYWEHGEDRRILFGTADSWLWALDADTGLPVPAFGDSGKVDLGSAGFDRPVNREWVTTLSPPIICREGQRMAPPTTASASASGTFSSCTMACGTSILRRHPS